MIQRWRTFGTRVTCAFVVAAVGLNVLVTGTPSMTELARWPATAGTAGAMFGIGYLGLCAAEFALGLVTTRPP